jgi:hypothetical protein
MLTFAEYGSAKRSIITVKKHSQQLIECLKALSIIMRLRFGSLTFDDTDFDGVPSQGPKPIEA